MEMINALGPERSLKMRIKNAIPEQEIPVRGFCFYGPLGKSPDQMDTKKW